MCMMCILYKGRSELLIDLCFIVKKKTLNFLYSFFDLWWSVLECHLQFSAFHSAKPIPMLLVRSLQRESKRDVCEKDKKDLENVFLVDTNMSLFSNVCLPM